MAVRIAAAQTLEYREDLAAALSCVNDMAQQAAASGVHLLLFPEGFLQGYIVDEVGARRVALSLSSAEFAAVLAQLPPASPAMVIGIIERDGSSLYNTALVVKDGALVGRYRKAHLLPGEAALVAGSEAPIFSVDGLRFGINICFDTNFPEAARGVAVGGAALLLCPANNMMPRESAQKYKHLHNAIRGERCRETGLWLMSADVTGEREGRVAWGPTAVLAPTGEVVTQLPLGQPGLLIFDLPIN